MSFKAFEPTSSIKHFLIGAYRKS